MKNPFKKEDPALQEAIDSVLHSMRTTDPGSDEYAKLVEQLSKLNDLKTKNRRQPVSSDSLLSTIGSLLGIVIIVGYENKHVITTKALGLLSKFKI